MRNFFKDGTKGKFNDKSASALEKPRLTTELRDAFYRREHPTIDLLAAKGATFTPEMLEVAARMRDHHLVDMCIKKKLKPSEDLVKIAVDLRDIHLFTMLLQKADITISLHRYVDAFGTDAMCDELAKRPLPFLERPILNTALLSTP